MLATSIGTEKKNAWISVRSPVDAGHDVADRQLVVAGEVELVEVAVDGQAQVVLEVHADLGAEVAAQVVRREPEHAGEQRAGRASGRAAVVADDAVVEDPLLDQRQQADQDLGDDREHERGDDRAACSGGRTGRAGAATRPRARPAPAGCTPDRPSRSSAVAAGERRRRPSLTARGRRRDCGAATRPPSGRRGRRGARRGRRARPRGRRSAPSTSSSTARRAAPGRVGGGPAGVGDRQPHGAAVAGRRLADRRSRARRARR